MRKGQVTKRTQAMRAIADEALKSGCTPLDVLLDNMRYYYSKIKTAEKIFDDAIENKETPSVVMTALSKLCNFRSEAGRFAVEAAPYVHAKLAAVTVSGDKDNPLEVHSIDDMRKQIVGEAIDIGLMPNEAMALIGESLKEKSSNGNGGRPISVWPAESRSPAR